jgi:arginine deiminase
MRRRIHAYVEEDALSTASFSACSHTHIHTHTTHTHAHTHTVQIKDNKVARVKYVSVLSTPPLTNVFFFRSRTTR